ncbi:universal stress protein [Williamsia deligens]|uniref:Universal stress protein n=1 Tax=Williamsia deligens TaxID=321325 RepID=A0ABW3G3N9_9NOCA|nr:universal stress protein [Williamsia deligens]MCP2194078.1 Nucleotide-binding universal stress protein, UspA family [Williamsia deligens]
MTSSVDPTSDLIMIAYDGSENADRAIDHAARYLAGRRAAVVTAWETGTHQSARLSSAAGMQPLFTPGVDTQVDDLLREEAHSIAEAGVARARSGGLDAIPHLVEVTGTVWGALVEAADDLDVDVLVTGTRGASGIRALLHSSVAEAVLRHCSRPVLVVPARCAERRRPVDAGADGSLTP